MRSVGLFALELLAVLQLDDHDGLDGVVVFIDAEGAGDGFEALGLAEGLL